MMLKIQLYITGINYIWKKYIFDKNQITQINNLPVHSTQKQAGKGWPPHTDQDTAVYLDAEEPCKHAINEKYSSSHI